MATTQRLDSQVILITGGARGIGRATAEALVGRGAKVVLTDLDQPALDEAVAALGAERCLGVVADVCDLAAMEAAVEAALERFGRLDVAVANAGVASYGSVLAIDPAVFRRTVDINITGVFHTARAALPALERAGGYLLVVSSLAAFAPAPGLAAYNASKAGVEHFANALRLEVAHRGVDVGVAHMSWIDTPLVQDAKDDLPSFRRMLSKLPPPLNRTSPVQACVDAFVAGIEKRSRRVFCPGWVRGAFLNRNAINSRLGTRQTLAMVPEILPQMDDEVRALGRSTSARNVANDERVAGS